MMYVTKNSSNIISSAIIVFCALIQWHSGIAATLDLSDRPLFLSSTVEPNIMLTIDDSGSMRWEVLMSNGALAVHGAADNSGSLNFSATSATDKRELCAGYNVLAYNPSVDYIPWSGLDNAGNLYQNQSTGAARDNPFLTTGTRSLTNDFYYRWNDNGNGQYEMDECPIANANRIMVSTLPINQQTNYANWYSFYRKREYVAKAAYGSVIASTQGARIGMITINSNLSDNPRVNMPLQSMNADVNSGNKRALIDKLYTIASSGGTPLRNAAYQAGEYLSGRPNSWLQNGSIGQTFIDPRLPPTSGGTCQQNFSIVMTDGFYNGSFNAVGNTDVDGAGQWDGGTYADSYGNNASVNYSNTLADIAMRYYEEDLNTAAIAQVPINANDINQEQHVVTYTVAFGVEGTLKCDPDDTTDANGNACPASFPGWTDPSASSAKKIDDLLHAAYNGRGLFLSAANPQDLIQSLDKAISDISGRTASSASVAFNSTEIQPNSVVFQGRYNTDDWSGDLLYLPLVNSGNVGGAIASAATMLNNTLANDRVILTLRTDTNIGTPFRWGSITTGQQTELGNSDVLNYLRGEKNCESSSTLTCVSGNKTLRNRDKLLGDIVHSAATYVGAPDQLYNFDDYYTFATANANRTPVAYVGANDGMLHGFNAEVTATGNAIPLSTAKELVAFVPSILYSRLPNLSTPAYTHQYYVDATPSIGDVHFAGNWHTTLVSGLAAGGQEIFAIDITNPSNFTEANAASLVLWEFTDKDDADLGYTFSKPAIGKMANGNFAAVFGNGYNSTVDDTAMGGSIGTGEAVLYIADIATGTITKLSTGVGTVADPNGLSTPTLVDVDADFITDYAYAGDLHGNLWRFDLTSANPALWKVSFGNSPLFTATSPTGTPGARQAITSQPTFNFRSSASSNEGYMIYFGTGKYLETADNDTLNQPTQTFYAIWDKWSKSAGDGTFSVISRSNLLAQSILDEVTVNTTEVRVTSNNVADWAIHQGWYIDLINTSTNNNMGERQITKSLVRNGKVFFSTMIPGAEICTAGGTGWLMILNAKSGSRLDASAFDVNGDGVIDVNDNIPFTGGITVPVSGAKSKTGIISAPTLIEGTGGLTEFVGLGNSSGLVGLGDIFPVTSSGSGGGTSPPPDEKSTIKDGDCIGCSVTGVSKGIPFGRILWQQLK